MNTGFQAGASPLYDARHGLGALAPLFLAVVFALGGLALIYMAWRVIKRRKLHAQSCHKDRFTVHRH
jgi:hypothetical protein